MGPTSTNLAERDFKKKCPLFWDIFRFFIKLKLTCLWINWLFWKRAQKRTSSGDEEVTVNNFRLSLSSTKFSYSVGGIRMDGMVMNVQSNWRAIKGYIISKKVRSSQSLSVSSWAKGLLFTFLKLRRRSNLMWVHVRDIETCVWPSLCDWPSLKRHRRIKKDIRGQSSA